MRSKYHTAPSGSTAPIRGSIKRLCSVYLLTWQNPRKELRDTDLVDTGLGHRSTHNKYWTLQMLSLTRKVRDF